MHQKRWDIRGGINEPFGPFRLLKARLGGTDYDHVELEDGAVGTSFFNKSVEGRLELGAQAGGGLERELRPAGVASRLRGDRRRGVRAADDDVRRGACSRSRRSGRVA